MIPLTACSGRIKQYNLVISEDIKVKLQETIIDEHNKSPLPNGEFVFGTTKSPKTFVSEIVFKVRGRAYHLDSRYMYNAWGDRSVTIPDVIKYFYAYCHNEENCIVRGLFSDAGGSFVAEWKIIDGKAIRTVMTNSSDIVSAFSTNISPPMFD